MFSKRSELLKLGLSGKELAVKTNSLLYLEPDDVRCMTERLTKHLFYCTLAIDTNVKASVHVVFRELGKGFLCSHNILRQKCSLHRESPENLG